MRWLYVGLGIVAAAVFTLAGIGYSIQNAHVAQARADYSTPPREVFETLSDFEHWPDWHPGVTAMSRRDDADGQPVWQMRGGAGSTTLVLLSSSPPERFVVRADGGMFVGRWTVTVEPRSGGSRVTVTEEARIDNLVIRGLTVFQSKTASIEAMLRGLGAHFGEAVTPQPLT
ncbi:MAG: SRPBCC family protein [Gemmatimonadota bacterium]